MEGDADDNRTWMGTNTVTLRILEIINQQVQRRLNDEDVGRYLVDGVLQGWPGSRFHADSTEECTVVSRLLYIEAWMMEMSL